MDNFIQTFIDFIPYDKAFVKELMPKYEKEFYTIGMYIEAHSSSLSCTDNEFMEELFDFLDGNGFEVIRPVVTLPHETHPVELIPLYPGEKTSTINTKEIDEINEKLQEAIQKLQSTLAEYVPVQEVVLSFTSVEDNQRDLLEYSQLLASWAFWIRVCRRMELLRLVPEGRCGSTTVPRPP